MSKLSDKINLYLELVSTGATTPESAFHNIILEFGGGYHFVPRKNKRKKDLIIEEHERGTPAKSISELFGISINYVYRIITEHNGAEMTKRLMKRRTDYD